jgi:sterol desaturase/sphingolipid hydroxylase (fatty acid hydroxylase superfamily)
MLEHLGERLAACLNAAVRPTLWLIILVVIFVPLERIFAVQPQKILRKGIFTDLCYYFLSSLLPSVLLGAPLGLVAWTAHQAVPGEFLAATAALPLWARVFLGMVVGEIGYYWAHRWSHQIPFLWHFHAIHHSAEEVNFLVSSRAHPIDMVFGRFCSLVPIYVLGLGGPGTVSDSQVPVEVALIGIIWGFFIHANLRWRFGPLEWLVSTPAFHHWHHTRTGPINRNYSSTFPWLDRIFGTHYLPREFPESYGIDEKLPDSLLGQLVYPLVAEEPTGSSADVPAAAGVAPLSSATELDTQEFAVRDNPYRVESD